MYKRKVLIILFVMFIFTIPICYAPPVTSEDNQGLLDAMNKMMKTSSKDVSEDVNRNMDENFLQLDNRMVNNMKSLFVKAIFALGGLCCLAMFGFAYFQNKVAKRYEINFYEKMMDSKLEKISMSSNIVSSSLYVQVTKPQFEKKFSTNEDYFEGIAETQEISTLKDEVGSLRRELNKLKPKDDSNDLYSSVKNESSKKVNFPNINVNWKKILLYGLGILGFVIILILLYFYLKVKFFSSVGGA